MISLRRTWATEEVVVAEGVAAVDVVAAEEELVEYPAVMDPGEVAMEAAVVAEVVAVVEHSYLPMFEEIPTDLGIMTFMTDPVAEVSLQLNHILAQKCTTNKKSTILV